MPRIAVFSDMQLSNRDPWELPELAGADVGRVDLCIVPGDHHPPLERSLRSLAPLARRLPVVYVPGNRDYYYGDLVDATVSARGLAAELGIVLLQDDVAEVAGIRIVGATLYTDYALDGDVEKAFRHARERISDHRLATLGGAAFTPEVAAAVHARSRRLIADALATPFPGATVVATHHAPHPGAIGPAHEGSDGNASFASDLRPMLEGPGAPDLWVHGGTHHPFDGTVGRTRVVSNPGGYAGEVAGFRLGKVVDLQGRG